MSQETNIGSTVKLQVYPEVFIIFHNMTYSHGIKKNDKNRNINKNAYEAHPVTFFWVILQDDWKTLKYCGANIR